MPRRRRISQVSLSSEHSTNSDLNDTLNINDELPDPGLPKTNSKEKKKSKNTTEDLRQVLSHFDFQEFTPHTDEELKLRAERFELDAKKQKKTTAKERTTKKQAAKEAREAKEAKKKEAEAKKEAAKKAIEEEKAAKAELEQNNKIQKPLECMKHIAIEIHSSLSREWYMADTLREARALGVPVSLTDSIPHAGMLVWTRPVQPRFTTTGGQVKLTASREQCRHTLFIMPPGELEQLVEKDCAASYLVRRRALAGTPLTALRLRAAHCPGQRKNGNAAKRSDRNTLLAKILDLQIDLIVSHKIDLVTVESSTHLAMLIMRYTRAVAEAPYKKAQQQIDEQAQFYMRGDNKNCVTVDNNGNGLSRLWEQMIAVLPQSSLEVARTLGAEYKTPSALSQELQNVDGVAKIADIGISRTNVPGAKSRRLGPEFARKLHTLFTAEDGDTVIE